MATQVPVTVLTGFLGSGKTTLLNHILTANHGKRIAVIENEYGEIGIDQELVIRSEEEIFEMNNGCLCCTVRGDLIRILGNLMKRRDKFDSILIETTGMADPGPVAQTFFMDADLQKHTRLDGIITVVDAKHVLQHWGTHEVQEQLAFADVILMNKIDLITVAEGDALAEKISKINALAHIIRTNHAKVSMDQILNVQGFNLDRILEHEPDFLRGAPKAGALSLSTIEDDHHHEHDHVHDDEVGSVGIVQPGALNTKKFNGWISELLQTYGADIFRSKGVLNLHGDPKRFVFQGVHMMLDGKPDRAWKPGEERVSKLVFIGRNLDRAMLTAGVQSCLA